jgi:hypothetical protein
MAIAVATAATAAAISTGERARDMATSDLVVTVSLDKPNTDGIRTAP